MAALTLTLSPGTITIAPGGSGTIRANVGEAGYPAKVWLGGWAPTGVDISVIPSPLIMDYPPWSCDVFFFVAHDVPEGSYGVEVWALSETGDAVKQTIAVNVSAEVPPPPYPPVEIDLPTMGAIALAVVDLSLIGYYIATHIFR